MARLIYQKDRGNCYRLHIEIWKQDGGSLTTNRVLDKFERNCALHVYDRLQEEGFLSHCEGAAACLLTRRHNFLGHGKGQGEESDLQQVLRAHALDYLQTVADIFSECRTCAHCEKFMVYDAKANMMVPPSQEIVVKRDLWTQDRKDERRESRKLFHENCAYKYLRFSTSPASQGQARTPS